MESWSQSSWLLSCATRPVGSCLALTFESTLLVTNSCYSLPVAFLCVLRSIQGCCRWCECARVVDSASGVEVWWEAGGHREWQHRLSIWGMDVTVLFPNMYIYAGSIEWCVTSWQELLKTAGDRSPEKPAPVLEGDVLESKIAFSKAETSQLYLAAGLGGVRSRSHPPPTPHSSCSPNLT